MTQVGIRVTKLFKFLDKKLIKRVWKALVNYFINNGSAAPSLYIVVINNYKQLISDATLLSFVKSLEIDHEIVKGHGLGSFIYKFWIFFFDTNNHIQTKK